MTQQVQAYSSKLNGTESERKNLKYFLTYTAVVSSQPKFGPPATHTSPASLMLSGRKKLQFKLSKTYNLFLPKERKRNFYSRGNFLSGTFFDE